MGGRAYGQFLEEHWNRIRGVEQRTGEDDIWNIPPFPLIDYEEPETLRKWLENTLECLEDEQCTRAYRQLSYARFYNAINDTGLKDSRNYENKDGQRFSSSARQLFNHARDFVDQFVSRMMRYPPNLNVLPNNSEYRDRIAARFGKRVIDNVFRINEVESVLQGWLQEAKICGESFLFTTFNPNIGELHPDWKKLSNFTEKQQKRIRRQAGEREVGGLRRRFENSDGDSITLDIAKKVGEIEYENPVAWLVFHETQVKWRDVNYIFKGKLKHIDQVVAENPEVDVNRLQVLDMEKNRNGSYGPGFKYGNWVVEYEFFHRATELLDDGFYARFVPGVLLKHGKLPYSHGKLPVVRMTDIDDKLNAHGRSFFDDLRPPLLLHNKMIHLMYRNVALGAHPKWVVQQGSVNFDSLANGPAIMEVEPGAAEPKLVTFNTVGNDVFTLSNDFLKQTEKLSGTFPMSRGQQLPNARAAQILTFFDEKEQERESRQVAKYIKAIEKLGELTLGTAGDFYQSSDQRTIRIIGRTGVHRIKRIEDTAKLSGPHDVKVERTTALADSKQGRISQIAELQKLPLGDKEGMGGLFTREQILRMIEVADNRTFFDMATAAVDKAESENEDMFEGEEVHDPVEWEAHIIHWNVHFQFMQSREFTDGVPDEVRNLFVDHLRATEFFMYMFAGKSASFAQGLLANIYFPAVFKIGDQPSISQLVMMHMQGTPPVVGQDGSVSGPPAAPSPVNAPEPLPPEAGLVPPEAEQGEGLLLNGAG